LFLKVEHVATLANVRCPISRRAGLLAHEQAPPVGFVSCIAGCGQAESDNKTRRRKPLKAERPISVSSGASPTRQAICQCWKKSFGFVGSGRARLPI